MEPNQTLEFLARAHADTGLGARVRAALSFESIAAAATEHGFDASAGTLRALFAARSAAVLSKAMHEAGMAEQEISPPGTGWDARLWSRLEEMDLEFVHRQLTGRNGWDSLRARYIERRYRRFLYLAFQPEFPAVPTQEVDQYWHQHILNTVQYSEQTRTAGGRFLHHQPSSGEPGEAEGLSLEFERTVVSYEQIFGEPYVETPGEALLNRYPRRLAA